VCPSTPVGEGDRLVQERGKPLLHGNDCATAAGRAR
jgi:hypothetical protein